MSFGSFLQNNIILSQKLVLTYIKGKHCIHPCKMRMHNFSVVINRKTSGLLNSYLTGFTRSLLTNAVGLCRVKAYYTELAGASLYMAINETSHSQMHLTLTLVVVNEIHSLIMIFMTSPTRVRVCEGLDRGLGLNSGLACHFLLNFQARISALLPAINPLYTEFHFLEVLLRLLIPCMICISTSAIS